jgi:hypothetical protein
VSKVAGQAAALGVSRRAQMSAVKSTFALLLFIAARRKFVPLTRESSHSSPLQPGLHKIIFFERHWGCSWRVVHEAPHAQGPVCER